MHGVPIFEMETLAHHEAIPGHHMQIAIAQELSGIPKFRRFGGNTAYDEGWALYAEYFPKEFGFYPWGPTGSGEARFVCSWDTPDDDVDALCAALAKLR